MYFGLHFFVHSDRGYHVARCLKAGKIHFKMTPKIRGSKIFGGVALLELSLIHISEPTRPY